jgi:hypothetical protein
VRGEECDRIVSPVIREIALHKERFGHIVVHWQQLDRSDAEVDEVVQGGLVREPGIGAAELVRHTGVGRGEPTHVHLVEDRVGERMPGARCRRPGRGSCNQAARHVASRIQHAARGVVIRCIVEQFESEAHAAIDGPGVGVEEKLGRVITKTSGGIVGSRVYADPTRPVNLARFCFLNPHATALYPHWDDAANTTVAMLRIEAGRDPYDRDLSDLIGELSTRSETFRNRWAAHNVVLHRAGAKQFHHPVVGEVTLAYYGVMELSADTGLTLTAYSPEPDSPSQDGLALLASWAATQDQTDLEQAARPTREPNGRRDLPNR